MGRVADGIDISILGDRVLERKFGRLPVAMQRKILRPALKQAGTRMRKRVAAAAPVRTGRLRQALKQTKVRSFTARGGVLAGPLLPTREELGIEPDDPWYYLMAIEYGAKGKQTRFPARPFIRPTTDRFAEAEFGAIAAALRKKLGMVARRA